MYISPHALQAVSAHIAEGIAMPWNVRTKHGTFANENTDFGLDVFPVKPVFHLHLMDGKLRNHGEILVIERREDGLWTRVRTDEFAHEFITTKRAGWSLGAMDHHISVTSNGYLTQFVIAEISFGEEEQLANQPGTTRAIAIQSFYKQSLPQDAALVKGVLVMPSDAENVENAEDQVEPAAPAPPVDPPGEAESPDVANNMLQIPDGRQLMATLDSIVARLTAIEELPTRVLAPAAPPPVVPPVVPRIEVASRYAGRSLLGMLFEDRMKMTLAMVDAGSVHVRGNDWYRELNDKVRVAWNSVSHEKIPGQNLQCAPYMMGFDKKGDEIYSVPSAMITQSVFDMFHARIPNLMAEEAMRTDFTNFGAELIPTLYSTVMYHFFRARSIVFATLDAFTPTSFPNFSWPKTTGGPTFRKVPEFSDDVQRASGTIPSSKVGTDKVDFAAGKIGARTIFSEELVMGSAPDFLDSMAMEYVQETAEQWDWVLMNGDETASAANISHGVDPTNTVFDKALVMHGLRYMTIIDVTADSVAHATIAKTTPGVGTALMGTRGRLGRDIENIRMFTNPESADKYDALDVYESISDVGAANATLLNGQVGAVKGRPLLSTESIELGDANGKYPGTADPHTGGTVGSTVFVHVPTIKVAIFKPPTFNTKFLLEAQGYEMLTWLYSDIKQMEDGGTATLFNHTN